MGVLYNINKFTLLNTLKFPKRESYKHEGRYDTYACNERKWILAGDRYVYHYYKNSTENHPNKFFKTLYVDTEDINEYYKEYPINCVN